MVDVSYESGPNLVKPAWTDKSRALSAQKVSQESNRVPTGSRPSTMQSSLPQSSQTDRVASRANAPDAPQFTAHDFFSGNWSTNSNGDMEDSTAGIAVNKEFEETKDSYFPYGPNSDEFDVKSAKSIDSIGSQDLQVALAIADPPRNLVLAASAAVVILSVYDQV